AAWEQAGRRFDPMHAAVSRAVYVAKDAADKQRALEQRSIARHRMNVLAERPDGNNTATLMQFADKRDASDESALFGTVDEIAEKLERLRGYGIEYILFNCAGGSRETLRRFAREIMPAFADAPKIRAVG
ncbi:MAG TPA: hypothetical protein VHG27_07025, partial [Xanthobacteraceae bacterium]|nr:hypothetical protein [Xanthobacteraceae bacterium]